MIPHLRIASAGFLTVLSLFTTAPLFAAVSYDIVYVRQARYGPNTNIGQTVAALG